MHIIDDDDDGTDKDGSPKQVKPANSLAQALFQSLESKIVSIVCSVYILFVLKFIVYSEYFCV